MIKVMEKFLYKEQLNNVGLSVLGTDEPNIWLRSINMSNKKNLIGPKTVHCLSPYRFQASNETSRIMIQKHGCEY